MKKTLPKPYIWTPRDQELWTPKDRELVKEEMMLNAQHLHGFGVARVTTLGTLSMTESSSSPFTAQSFDGSVDFTADIGTGTADRFVFVATGIGGNGGNSTITSVIVDPTGANITLTALVTNKFTIRSICAIYAGIVATGDGSKVIRVAGANTASDWCNVGVWYGIGIGTNVATILKDSNTSQGTTDTGTFDVSVNTEINGAVLVVHAGDSPTSMAITNQVGHTEISDDFTNYGSNYLGHSLALSSAETPRTVTADWASGNIPKTVAAAASIVGTEPA